MIQNNPKPGRPDHKRIISAFLIVALGLGTSCVQVTPKSRSEQAVPASVGMVQVTQGGRDGVAHVEAGHGQTRQPSGDTDRAADARRFPVPPGTQAMWLQSQVDGVREAARSGKHPERLTASLDGPPWDLAAYLLDPLAYLGQTVPSRAWQDGSEPGMPACELLEPIGVVTVSQGTPVVLRVRTAPHAPVSVLATAGGAFDNGLASQTVAADASGTAVLSWRATPDTVAQAGITIASPGAIGVVKTVVVVR